MWQSNRQTRRRLEEDSLEEAKRRKLDTDSLEETWQNELIETINNVDHTEPMHRYVISQVLDGPCKANGYTLDFFTTKKVAGSLWTSCESPISSVLRNKCKDCLLKLIHCGVNVNYTLCDNHWTPLLECNKVFIDDWEDNAGARIAFFEFMQILLQNGADPNIHCDKEGYVIAQVEDPNIVQLLLDNGARITTANQESVSVNDPRSFLYGPWVSAIVYGSKEKLKVLLDYSEKHKLSIPLDIIFSSLSDFTDRFHCGFEYDCLEFFLSRGYRLDVNTELTRRVLTIALIDPTGKGVKVGMMMIEQSPMLLQACRIILNGRTVPPIVRELLSNPPSLQSLCKGVIISTLGDQYVDKVKQLPLPKIIQKYIERV